jgi:hypothetical protein
MEFLYSLNRLNVATSRQVSVRAGGLSRVVRAGVLHAGHMELANALCRYLEEARRLPLVLA